MNGQINDVIYLLTVTVALGLKLSEHYLLPSLKLIVGIRLVTENAKLVKLRFRDFNLVESDLQELSGSCFV